MPAPFALDPRLAADTLPVGDLPVSTVLLVDDARYPWFILVPRRPGLSEITDLSVADGGAVADELRLAVRVMTGLMRPDKVNVGALGNVVAQLHWHVVARFHSDAAWPGPVWGSGPREPYPAHAAAAFVDRAAAAFAAA